MNFDILINEYYKSTKSDKNLILQIIDILKEFFKNTKIPKKERIVFGILCISTLVLIISSITWFFCKTNIFIYIMLASLVFMLITVLLLCIIDNIPKYESIKIQNRKELSNKSLEDLTTFLSKEYSIDKNDTETLELLLKEAEINKEKYDNIKKIKNSTVKTSTIFFSIITYLLGIITNIDKNEETLNNIVMSELPTIFMFIIIFTFLHFVITSIIIPEISLLLNKKYYFHEDFMEKLRQIIIDASIEKNIKNKEKNKNKKGAVN